MVNNNNYTSIHIHTYMYVCMYVITNHTRYYTLNFERLFDISEKPVVVNRLK